MARMQMTSLTATPNTFWSVPTRGATARNIRNELTVPIFPQPVAMNGLVLMLAAESSGTPGRRFTITPIQAGGRWKISGAKSRTDNWHPLLTRNKSIFFPTVVTAKHLKFTAGFRVGQRHLRRVGRTGGDLRRTKNCGHRFPATSNTKGPHRLAGH